ncbi:7763_t:CDS:2 [Dentiscutata heterogama]|uniref:7763_t:CDS:1 n=1 Tax=Dentiscutata heterogama TaxID=1316150 RepID=A0ACA9PTQ6_9GLOM|nr:7763_t:CDS:2 [Dentiscutata heterogama]
MPEYEVVAVVVEVVEVELSRVAKGRNFELEIVELLKRLGFEVIHNDGGIDIRARIRGIDFVFQCKDWERPTVVRELDGALTQPENSGAIGVVVIPDNSRFSLKTIERAITSVFPIILTDKAHLPTYILNTILDRLQGDPFIFRFLY